VGLVVKPRPWVSLYSSWSSSYEMNGQDWNDPSILVGPTRAAQLEAGAKASLLGERLGVTLTAFRLAKRDVYGAVQTDTLPTAFPVISFSEEWGQATYQGGRHRSQGVELDVNGRLTRDLSVNAAASFIDAVVVRDPAFASGNQLGGNARRIGNVWANYRVPRGPLAGVELGGGAFYRGAFFPNTANAADERVSPFHSFDAAIGYAFGRLAARLNVSNLTNEVGYLSSRGVFEPLWVRRAVLSLSTTF
jgi:iron complex outermembrane receptor protein